MHSFVKCVTAMYIITLAACSNASQCIYVNFKIGEMYVSQVGNLGELTFQTITCLTRALIGLYKNCRT